MNLSSNGQVIAAITKDLALRFHELQHTWRDAKSNELEERFLYPLTSSVDRALPAFETLQKLLSKVREDCE
jgi:hypothetical protein